MFIKKTSLELEGLTPEQLDAYKVAQEIYNDEVVDEKIKTKINSFGLEAKIEKEVSNQILDKIKTTEKPFNFFEALKASITEKREEILSLKTNRNGNVKLEVGKAVVDMTFATNTTGRVGRTEVDSNFYGIKRPSPFVGQLISLSTTNARTYVYIDKTGHEGAPTMTAEGVVKPVGDWNLVEKTVNPKKIAFIVTVSKEMLDDIDNMANDVMQEIQEQILDQMERQWINGDGIGDNIDGISKNATPFAAGANANTIDNANNLDVLRVAIKQVVLNNFYPTSIIISPEDGAKMDLEKTTQGEYLLPPFASIDNTVIKGVKVVESNFITAGTFLVGDFTRYKGKVREGAVMDMGYSTGDWEKNFVSFLGESRFLGYIPTNHFGAIVKGSFTAAKLLLETP